MSAEFTAGWLSLNSVATKHVKLSQIDFPTNSEVTDDGSGTIYAEQLALTGWAPVANGTTGAIATMLAQFGIGGACIGSAFTITSADVIYRKVGTCDAPLSGTPHFRHRMSKGLGILNALSASRNQDASITWSIHALSDSGGAPVSPTDGVAAVVPENERYRLAISKIAGVQFPEIDSINIGFNVELTPKDPSLTGVIYPEDVGVISVRPVVDIQGQDLSRVKATLIELAANAATHTNTTLQLAALEDSASFYGFGTSNHTELTVAGLAVPTNLGSASARSRANNSIQLTSAYDGTNAPIVATLGTSISASP